MDEEQKRAELIMRLVKSSIDQGPLAAWANAWLDHLNVVNTDEEREMAWALFEDQTLAILRDMKAVFDKYGPPNTTKPDQPP
jgi:hypothetical protein